MRLPVLLAVFVVFVAYSVTVIATDGPVGFLTLAWRERWAMQMLVDLALALSVAWVWLRRDAAARGLPAWPYQLATVALGSVGVLAYLVHREVVARRQVAPTA